MNQTLYSMTSLKPLIAWVTGRPDACFDAFYSDDSFEHAFGPAQVAKEFDRAVRPGGIITVSVPENTRAAAPVSDGSWRHGAQKGHG